jgi:site-specific recombinase XerD
MIPFGKRPKKLPTVLGQEEVHDLIQCVAHPKHRAVLLTLYAAGLRLAEATHLKLPDIDSQRMQLKINGGKGGKDRYVPISPKLLEAGVDLMAISKLLGHSSFLTTMIYLHCRSQHFNSAPSPIDWLPTRQCPRWVDPSLQAPKQTPPEQDKDNNHPH